MSAKGNLRRHHRKPKTAVVQLMWKDRFGNDKFANARTLDISESGMRVEMPEPLVERSYVVLRAESVGLRGQASVRSCSRTGSKYTIGLEFSGGLKWTPPKSAAPQDAAEHALPAPGAKL